jgi:hypothetical protein
VAASAFLGAVIISIPSSKERKIGMYISLPWASAR